MTAYTVLQAAYAACKRYITIQCLINLIQHQTVAIT